MDSRSRIFVAGHQGLVGSAILRHLRASGFENLLTRTRPDLDLTDQTAVIRFFETERPSHVFLAAAKVGGILANSTFPVDFLRDNLLIAANVVDAAWRTGAEKLLFLGSSCIYPKNSPQPMREEHLLTGSLEPTNEWYAVAKIAGLKLCQAYRQQHGFNAISLMPTNLYGPGDNFDLLSSHVLPALIRKFHLAKLASEGRWDGIAADERRFGPIPSAFLDGLRASGGSKVTLWGTGSPKREFLYVEDLADASVFLMNRYESEEIINVGIGEDSTIEELARVVAGVVGFSGEVEWDTDKPDGTPRKLLDVSRLHALGWKHSVDLVAGLDRTYRWYVQQVC